MTEAIGSDSRVGRKYLRGGLGFGGPCFPRDVRALSALCRELGVEASLPDAVSDTNDALAMLISDIVSRASVGNGAIGVLGLAYRPGTEIADGSHAVEIVRRLASRGLRVHVYDPLLHPDLVPQLAGLPITWCASTESLCKWSTTIVIASPEVEFRSIRPDWLAAKTIVDCWRWLPLATVEAMAATSPPARYLPWGRNLSSDDEVVIADPKPANGGAVVIPPVADFESVLAPSADQGAIR